MSRPRIVADPEVGKMIPISSLSVVVLPAPLGPRKPNVSPVSTVRFSDFNAGRRFFFQKPTAYSLVRLLISMASMSHQNASRNLIAPALLRAMSESPIRVPLLYRRKLGRIGASRPRYQSHDSGFISCRTTPSSELQ